MTFFGWSLPPGCSSLPDEGYVPHCGVCAGDVEDPGTKPGQCLCPECLVCGATGDPLCYEEHGLVRSENQIAQKKRADEIDAAEALEQADADKQMAEDYAKYESLELEPYDDPYEEEIARNLGLI